MFIDEAYDLDPKGDFKGKPIVSELLVKIINKVKYILNILMVFIFFRLLQKTIVMT